MSEQAVRTHNYHQRLRDQGLAPVRLWLKEDHVAELKSLAFALDANLSQVVTALIRNPASMSQWREMIREKSIPIEDLM